MTHLINGKEIASKLKIELKEEIEELKTKYNDCPCLAVVQVGLNPASSVYVKSKTKSAKEVGIEISDHHLEESITEKKLLDLIKDLNSNSKINGILVQLPLPKHINEQKILDSIMPEKDVDGFHPVNVGKLSISNSNNNNLLVPCTPFGCLLMLKQLKIDLVGKNAVIIGRSNIVGKPMAQLLLKESCTVTIAHSKTKNLEKISASADILIAAVGRAELITKEWIKKNAIVIDVGINRIDTNDENKKYKIVGDVNFEEAKKMAFAVSPVPGGVGPMTIACLLKNTKIAYLNSKTK